MLNEISDDLVCASLWFELPKTPFVYPDLGFGTLRPCSRLLTGGNADQSARRRTQRPTNRVDSLLPVPGIWREGLKVNESEARATNDSKVHSESSFTFAHWVEARTSVPSGPGPTNTRRFESFTSGERSHADNYFRNYRFPTSTVEIRNVPWLTQQLRDTL